MGDLISRQNAIRWVKTECNPYGKPSLDYESGVKVINHLENMRSEQQWIPCSERLPEPWTSVLVTYIYNGKRFVEESQYTGQDDERGNPLFSSYADEYKVSNAYFQKIAWMPLPEPYKGEEK